MTTRTPIDTRFLLRQVSSLNKVREHEQTWDEFGDGLARLKQWPPSPVHLMDRLPEDPAASATWNMAKELVHGVITSEDPKNVAIRRRLGDLSQPSTPRLLTTLSLWLAGVLGLSVSKTSPMVATMLYAVAKSPDDWDVLRN